MKLDTITKYREFIEEMLNGDYTSLKDFCDQNNLNYNSVKVQLCTMKNETGEYKDLCDEALSKYQEVKNKWNTVSEEIADTDERITSSILRNTEGKIVGYKFKVYRRDNTPVSGVLTRDEMNDIYRLYSYYGAGITQREISRKFPDYSLVDFKRILRAFNITKASGPFAPHMYEEKTEDELKEYHLREKENDFLKKIEKDELNDIKRTTIKLARENRELKEQLDSFSEIKVDLSGSETTSIYSPPFPSENSIIIHLSDLHHHILFS